MKPELENYRNRKVCVAVSGGKDSMALLHYLYIHGSEYGITLSALNCDHGIRGEPSARDSAFVKKWCEEHKIPLQCFKEDCASLAKKRRVSVELAAREWRQWCYFKAAEEGGAAIATAHHLNDNAETVLFHLTRGASLAGVTGIREGDMRIRAAIGADGLPRPVWEGENGRFCTVTIEMLRPLLDCTREEIDEYIAVNHIPYVEDESNFTDDYTRNKIRHNVLPSLEEAVPGAAKALSRFSRLAAEIDEYIHWQTAKLNLLSFNGGALIKHCDDYVPFAHAAVFVIKQHFERKDYTTAHVDALFDLQFKDKGKKYEFLDLVAYKEEGRIAVCEKNATIRGEAAFAYKNGIFGDFQLNIAESTDKFPYYIRNGEGTYLLKDYGKEPVILRFDRDKMPETAVIRTRREGDRFTKFGGGTKKLGDYFTDKKVPLRLRDRLPLIAVGSDILAVCGLEISENIKIDENTRSVGYIWCDALI